MAEQPADLAAARDEVERLRRELAGAEATQRRLADELQHRVRNMLAMVRSIARQTWEEGASQDDYAQHLQGRLDAIARYQMHLGSARAPGFDLEDMIRDALLETHYLDGPRCSITGPPVCLYERQAELVGMAIHELSTNAIKFGAFAQGGKLAIDWSLAGTQLDFRWVETGVSVTSSAPRRLGFGRRLIETALTYELDAVTSFDLKPGGLVCGIAMPVPAQSVDTSQAHDSAPERLSLISPSPDEAP